MIGNGQTHLYIILFFFFFLKMLSLLTMVEVGSVAFLTVSTLSVMPTTYSSVVTEPTHSTAMNLTPEVVVVSLVSFLDLVRGQTWPEIWDNFSQASYYLAFTRWPFDLCWFFIILSWRGRQSLQLLNEPGSAITLLLLATSACFTDISCALHTRFTILKVSKGRRGSELAGTGSCQLPTMVDERQSHHLGSQVSLTLHCVNMIMILQEAKC